MEKGKHEKEKVKLFEIYTVLLLIATLFMSIGYANIIDQEMVITGTTTAEAQDGVFITDVEYYINTGADTANSSVDYFLGTMLSSKVTLGSSASSSYTYKVTIYNSTDREQVFIGVLTNTTDPIQYSNTNIWYSVESVADLTGLEEYVTTIAPGGTINFPVTFKYSGTNVSNPVLDSMLNFRFREKPVLELSNEGTTYTKQNITAGYEEEYQFTVSNYNLNSINGVPMKYTLGTSITSGSPLVAKIYDENGTEVTENINMAGDGSNIDHTYTLKITWDSSLTDTEYEGKNYICTVNLVAKPTDTDYAEYSIKKEFGVNITTCAHSYTYGICTICGKVCTHSYGAWETEIEATCTEAGTLKRTCTVCGEIEIATIAALEHNYTNGVCTRCGDRLHYVGCYADLTGDGTVEGVIFADLGYGTVGDGNWGLNGTYTIPKVTSGLKSYEISQESYTDVFGTAPVVTPADEGENRFYIMALENYGSESYTWYKNAGWGNPIPSKITTETSFGSGRQNTLDLMKWSSLTEFGSLSESDIWSVVGDALQSGWFIPSWEEWAAFCGELIHGANGYAGLSGSSWTSSVVTVGPINTYGLVIISFHEARFMGRQPPQSEPLRLCTMF